MRYLSLDPGNTTGWALFEDGKPDTMGEVPWGDEYFQFLRDCPPVEVIVCENYRLLPPKRTGSQKTHQFSEVIPIRAIGAAQFEASNRGCRWVTQELSIKEAASKRFGIPNNGNHMLDAVLHGMWFWLKETGDAPPAFEDSRPDSVGPRVRRPTRVAQISSYQGLRTAWRDSGVGMQKKGL